MTEFVGPDPGPQPEFVVTDVVDHEGSGRGRKYRVRWSTGELTWEPRKNLVDRIGKGKGAKEVMNDPFRRYLERNQMLRKK
jgi:hypothetical protein